MVYAHFFAAAARPEVGCLTSFREPVPRIMSCYSDRLVGSEHVAPACMGDLGLQLTALLLLQGTFRSTASTKDLRGKLEEIVGGPRLRERAVPEAPYQSLVQCAQEMSDDQRNPFERATGTDSSAR